MFLSPSLRIIHKTFIYAKFFQFLPTCNTSPLPNCFSFLCIPKTGLIQGSIFVGGNVPKNIFIPNFSIMLWSFELDCQDVAIRTPNSVACSLASNKFLEPFFF